MLGHFKYVNKLPTLFLQLWVAALVSFPAMPLALSQLIFNALGLGGNTVCYNVSRAHSIAKMTN